MTPKPPPPEAIAARPALAHWPDAQHPVNGPKLAPPPPRYSEPLKDAIVASIKRGNRPQIAAAAAGLPINTYYAWMRQGKAGDPHLYQFMLDVEQAMAQAETQAIETIAGAAGDFQMEPENAKWWLDRARPDGYSKEVATKVNALLNEFMNRLEQNLPSVITKEMIGLSPFELVIGASSGQELRLGSGTQEEL